MNLAPEHQYQCQLEHSGVRMQLAACSRGGRVRPQMARSGGAVYKEEHLLLIENHPIDC